MLLINITIHVVIVLIVSLYCCCCCYWYYCIAILAVIVINVVKVVIGTVAIIVVGAAGPISGSYKAYATFSGPRLVSEARRSQLFDFNCCDSTTTGAQRLWRESSLSSQAPAATSQTGASRSNHFLKPARLLPVYKGKRKGCRDTRTLRSPEP